MDILKKYYHEIFLGILFILIIGLYGLYYYEKNSSTEVFQNTNPVTTEEPINEVTEENNMYVEIKGQVENPGVYAVTPHNIIDDVINMAGGLTPYAYTKNINLSKKVSDEMVIIVYSAYEYSLTKTPSIVYVDKPCKCDTSDITSCVENGSSIIENGPSASDNQEEKGLININTATEAELDTLDGIGASKAQAIIKYRSENGNFNSIEEITNVSGISQNIFAKIKDSITV